MIKRNANLFIKLFLLVIFILLVILIAQCAENNKTPEISNDTASVDHVVEAATETTVDAAVESIDTYTESVPMETAPVDSTESISLKTSPVLFSEIDYALYYDPDPTKELLFKIQVAIERIEKIDMSEYTTDAAAVMAIELNRLIELEQKVSSDLKHYLKWEKEHYYATKVWEYFMQRGFSSEVTCAIIGNMMIETAGGTLKLNPTIYSPSRNYYGLCQWSMKYYPEAKDLPFEHQLDYLLGSMPWEFNTFGKLYKSGFNYVSFLKMTDISKAARAFAEVYERCGSGSYKLRQEAALRAYAYFDLNS